MGGEERVARQHPSGRLDGTGGGGSFAQSRRFLPYLPSSVWEAPPVVLGDDRADRREEELAEIIPRDRRTPYDAPVAARAGVRPRLGLRARGPLRPTRHHRPG